MPAITVFPKPASEPGALDGYAYRCECGAQQGTSLGEREARNLAAAHQRWHAQRDQAQARAEYGRLARSA